VAKAGSIRAGGAFVELFGEDSALRRTLARAQDRLKNFASGVRTIGAGVAAGGALLTAPLAASVNLFSTYGDSIAKMARRTGLATETLSGLAYAADLSGTSIEAIEKGVRRMSRTIYDAERGSKEAADGLAAIGLSAQALKGLSPEEQFFTMSAALAEVADESTRAALAQILFGRAGTELIPLLSEGSEGIRRMRMEAEQLGLVLDKDAAKRAEELNDSLGRVKSSVKGVATQIGDALAPVVTELSNALAASIGAVARWVKENPGFVKGLAAVGATAITAGGALLALSAVVTVLATLSPALVPLTLGLGGAAAAIGLFVVGLQKLFGVEFNVRRTLRGISDAIRGGDIKLASQILWKEVRLAWVEGLADIRATFYQALRSMFENIPDSVLSVLPDSIRAAISGVPGLLDGLTAAEQEDVIRLKKELESLRAQIAGSSGAGARSGAIAAGAAAFRNVSGFAGDIVQRNIERFGQASPTQQIVSAIKTINRDMNVRLDRIERSPGLVFTA